jgi:riboflavin synthase
MFTGIIKAVSSVKKAAKRRGSLFLTIAKPVGWRLQAGESVAVDGVCLTVATIGRTSYVSELMPATLRQTSFGRKVPDAVNLERSLKFSERVGGHFVLGHVDAVGTIAGIKRQGRSYIYKIKFPRRFRKLIAVKGSVAADGISLTVVKAAPDYFTAALVAYTLSHTTLGRKKIGAPVNLEFDIIAKHLYA